MTAIRFSDTHADDGTPAPNVETRKVLFYWEGTPTRTGQIPVSWTCPFCNENVSTWLWSLSGGGKRCPGCKAITGKSLTSYQWKATA